jgi:uncharacterized damage-inducible protein DinB
MNRSAYMANRLRELFLNGKWIANTNYQDCLLALNWQHAVQTPLGLNSIAALSYHINYYLAGLLEVFDGGPLRISDKYSFDAPFIQSEQAWQERVQSLLQNAERFAALVESMDDAQLDANFVKPKYGTYLRNIEGVIEHSYYHLGQISLMKKLVGGGL